MEEKKISIIVPVYNVEKYLDKCIQSLCNQIYKNVEIILVDDGSTDQSGVICDRWSEIDSRIEVIHQNNGGLSSARNTGLDYCTGEYIGFVDSDDTIEPDMYSLLIDLMNTYGTDISICQFKKVDQNNNRLNPETKLRIHQFDSNEALTLIIGDDVITSHACNKLFLGTLWSNIRFPEGRIYEDISIMHEVFSKASSVVLTTEQKYNYLIRTDSTSYRTDVRRDIGLFRAFHDRYLFIDSNYGLSDLRQKCLAKVVIEGYGSVYRMNYYRTNGYKEAIDEIRAFYKVNRAEILGCKYLNHKQKMKVFLISKLFPFYNLLCVIYRKGR